MPTKDFRERSDAIFDVVVRSYIETAEPVASRTISKRHNFGLSPASIRNVMADLEEEGLLTHPHTSAGRVPTDKGYRYWVDALMKPELLTHEEKTQIIAELKKAKTVEGLADGISKVISKMTNNAAMMYFRNVKRVSFLNHILDELIQAQKIADFFEEDSEIFIEGALRIFEQPEFQDLSKMRHLLRAFDEKEYFQQIFLRDLDDEGIQIYIGQENEMEHLEDVSLVIKDCYLGDLAIGGVAVLGPTRMHYPKVVAVVDFVADSVSEAMGNF